MKKMNCLYTVAAILITGYPVNNTDGNKIISNQLQKVWDRSYGGADKSYDNELLRIRELIAPRFQTHIN
jgi:hypothetical protein